MSTADPQWLTTYCALELSLPLPILHSFSVWWCWLQSVVEQFHKRPHYFPWAQYRDSPALLILLSLHGKGIQWITDPTPEMCEAAVQQDPWALQFIDQVHYTPDLCRLAVSKDQHAIYLVPPHLRATLT